MASYPQGYAKLFLTAACGITLKMCREKSQFFNALCRYCCYDFMKPQYLIVPPTPLARKKWFARKPKMPL